MWTRECQITLPAAHKYNYHSFVWGSLDSIDMANTDYISYVFIEYTHSVTHICIYVCMRNELCRTFHPWCPCIKTRCLFSCILDDWFLMIWVRTDTGLSLCDVKGAYYRISIHKRCDTLGLEIEDFLTIQYHIDQFGGRFKWNKTPTLSARITYCRI